MSKIVYKGIYKKCIQCQKEFYCMPYQIKEKKFCSKTCFNDYAHIHRKGIVTVCDFCGKEVYKPLYRMSKYKYCNKVCQINAMRKNKKYCTNTGNFKQKKVICRYCNKEFLTNIKSKKIYCSMKCRTMHINYDKTLHPNYSGGQYIECQTCQKKFWSTPSNTQKYCSMECYSKDPLALNKKYGDDNPSKDPKVREKLRINTIKYIQSKSVNGVPITPMIGKNEKEILDNLEKELNIKIERNHQVLGYFLDGYCRELNLGIEIDEKHHKQRKYKKRDKFRENYIKKHTGYNIIRIRDGW